LPLIRILRRSAVYRLNSYAFTPLHHGLRTTATFPHHTCITPPHTTAHTAAYPRTHLRVATLLPAFLPFAKKFWLDYASVPCVHTRRFPTRYLPFVHSSSVTCHFTRRISHLVCGLVWFPLSLDLFTLHRWFVPTAAATAWCVTGRGLRACSFVPEFPFCARCRCRPGSRTRRKRAVVGRVCHCAPPAVAGFCSAVFFLGCVQPLHSPLLLCLQVRLDCAYTAVPRTRCRWLLGCPVAFTCVRGDLLVTTFVIHFVYVPPRPVGVYVYDAVRCDTLFPIFVTCILHTADSLWLLLFIID